MCAPYTSIYQSTLLTNTALKRKENIWKREQWHFREQVSARMSSSHLSKISSVTDKLNFSQKTQVSIDFHRLILNRVISFCIIWDIFFCLFIINKKCIWKFRNILNGTMPHRTTTYIFGHIISTLIMKPPSLWQCKTCLECKRQICLSASLLEWNSAP